MTRNSIPEQKEVLHGENVSRIGQHREMQIFTRPDYP